MIFDELLRRRRFGATREDITLSLDGDAMTSVTKSLNLAIDNDILDQKVLGKFQRAAPYLVSRDAELETEYYDDLAAINGDSVCTNGTLKAISLITAIVDLGLGGSDAITITNMYVDDESFGKIPGETDFILHKATLKMGGDCAISMG